MLAPYRTRGRGSRGVRREEIPLAALLVAACTPPAAGLDAELRSAECPPGCVCVCEPSTTSGSSSSSSSSSTASPVPDLPPDLPPATTGGSTTGGGLLGWPMTEGTHTVIFEGTARSYRVFHRQGWDGVTPMRPVFNFHACSGNPPLSNSLGFLHRNTTWDYLGPQGGYLVVAPQAETLPCFSTDPNGADVAFVEALVAETEAWEYADPTYRYFHGMSGGAYMAHAMACLMGADAMYGAMGGLSDPDLGVGTGPIDSADCVGPVDVLQSHGANDTRVPVAFGHEARDMWIEVNGCASPVVVPGPHDFCSGNGANNDPTPPCSCVEYTCASGSLTYCEDSGGHDWFGEQKTSARQHFSEQWAP